MSPRPGTGTRPSLRVERTLLRGGHRLVAGMDEVGRGALAGPVSVGVVVVDERTPTVPAGVRDSKLLPAAERERLVPRVRRWAVAHAVGHADAAEIDEHGIIAALRLAGRRALAALPVRPDVILLDGHHDWLTEPGEQGLLALLQETPSVPVVHTRVKADLHCSSVAAASVLAKVERDGIVTRLGGDFPHYGWAVNKGYGAPEHLAALSTHGTCEHHRRSWRLLAGASAARDDRRQGTTTATSDGEKERVR